MGAIVISKAAKHVRHIDLVFQIIYVGADHWSTRIAIVIAHVLNGSFIAEILIDKARVLRLRFFVLASRAELAADVIHLIRQVTLFPESIGNQVFFFIERGADVAHVGDVVGAASILPTVTD